MKTVAGMKGAFFLRVRSRTVALHEKGLPVPWSEARV
jgi:hypothetical protein